MLNQELTSLEACINDEIRATSSRLDLLRDAERLACDDPLATLLEVSRLHRLITALLRSLALTKELRTSIDLAEAFYTSAAPLTPTQAAAKPIVPGFFDTGAFDSNLYF